MKATVLLLSTFVLSWSAIADEASATHADLQLIENERVVVELTNDRLDRATLLRSFKVTGATQAGDKVALLDQLPPTVRLKAEGVPGGAAPEVGRTKSGPAVRFAIGEPVPVAPAAARVAAHGRRASAAAEKAPSGCGSSASGCGSSTGGCGSPARSPAHPPTGSPAPSCGASAPASGGCGSSTGGCGSPARSPAQPPTGSPGPSSGASAPASGGCGSSTGGCGSPARSPAHPPTGSPAPSYGDTASSGRPVVAQPVAARGATPTGQPSAATCTAGCCSSSPAGAKSSTTAQGRGSCAMAECTVCGSSGRPCNAAGGCPPTCSRPSAQEAQSPAAPPPAMRGATPTAQLAAATCTAGCCPAPPPSAVADRRPAPNVTAPAAGPSSTSCSAPTPGGCGSRAASAPTSGGCGSAGGGCGSRSGTPPLGYQAELTDPGRADEWARVALKSDHGPLKVGERASVKLTAWVKPHNGSPLGYAMLVPKEVDGAKLEVVTGPEGAKSRELPQGTLYQGEVGPGGATVEMVLAVTPTHASLLRLNRVFQFATRLPRPVGGPAWLKTSREVEHTATSTALYVGSAELKVDGP